MASGNGASIPDALTLAAVLVPAERALEHLRLVAAEVDRLRTTVLESLQAIDQDLGKALRSCQLARQAAMAHQEERH